MVMSITNQIDALREDAKVAICDFNANQLKNQRELIMSNTTRDLSADELEGVSGGCVGDCTGQCHNCGYYTVNPGTCVPFQGGTLCTGAAIFRPGPGR
jgi:hypothetical protein